MTKTAPTKDPEHPLYWDYLEWSDRFVTQFRKRRKALGYTQVQLEEKLGVCNGLVAKWEVGLRKPSMFTCFLWAEALDTELRLVDKDDKENRPSPDLSV